MADVGAVIKFKTVMEGAQQVPALGQSLDKLKTGLVGLGAAYLSIAGAQKAWDIAKQGADINQTRESFERMNAEVFKTPDLLDQMKEASRGTIGEIQLMQGLLKLTAGTTEEMGRSLGAAAPQLLEIAKASNKLNPALGDTAFLYDSIATGIKRGSPMILDNLGIVVKVEAANQKYADTLGKTVAQLTAEEKTIALLNATLEAGGNLINQVGGNVDSAADSYAQLEVAIKDAFDIFKEGVAESAAAQMRELADSGMDAADSFQEIARVLGDVLGQAIGSASSDVVKFIAILEGVQAGNLGEATGVSGLLKWTTLSDQEQQKARSQFGAFLKELGSGDPIQFLVDEFKDPPELIAAASLAGLETGRAFASGVEEGATPEDLSALEDFYDEGKRLFLEQQDDLRDIRRERMREEAAERQAALLAWNAEVQAAGRAGVVGAIGNLDNPQDLLVRPARTVSVATGPGPAAWQTEALERYQDALADTGQDLFDLQTGFRVTGDSAEDQAEAIAKAHEEMRRIQGAIDGLNISTQEYTQVQQDMTVNMDALNKLMFQRAIDDGLSTKSIIDIGLATGQLSEEQAEALRVQEALTVRAKILNEQVEAGALTADEAATGLQHFAENLTSTEESAGGATDAIVAAKEAALEFGETQPPPVKLQVDDSEVIAKLTNATTSLQAFGNLSAGELAMQRALQNGGNAPLPNVPVELRPEFQSVTTAILEDIPDSVEDVIIPLKPDSEEVDEKIYDLENDTVYISVIFVPQNDPTPPGGPRPQPRAGGGSVYEDEVYIVGDGGRPELFVPWTSGYVYPSVPASHQGAGQTGAAVMQRGGQPVYQDNSNITIYNGNREAAAITAGYVAMERKRKFDRFMGVGLE